MSFSCLLGIAAQHLPLQQEDKLNPEELFKYYFYCFYKDTHMQTSDRDTGVAKHLPS